MEKIKIITLCGSLKCIEKMWEVAEKLSLEKGYAVIGVNPHVIGRPLTEDEISTMKRLHKEKIAISDGIFVVNVDGCRTARAVLKSRTMSCQSERVPM